MEEKLRLTDELLTATPDQYSMDRVKDYLAEKIPDKGQVSVEEWGVRTREIMMIASASFIPVLWDFPMMCFLKKVQWKRKLRQSAGLR